MSVAPQPPTYQEAQILAQAQAVASGAAVVQDVGGATIITVPQVATPPQAPETEAAQGERLEAYKQAIYRHPLFPLMALLFEKCEQAAASHECPTSESFDEDIQSFVHHQEKDRKAFYSDDRELDNLMVKAIQVLRIHLLELEKVTELCKDFCTRYIACLKGKLQSENLLRIDNIYDDDDDSPLCLTPQPSQLTNPMQVPPQVMTPGVVTSVNGNVVIQPGGIPQSTVSMATISQGQIVSGNTVYQMVHTPQGIVAQPIQIQSPVQAAPLTPTGAVIHGSTPLSQIGLVGTPTTPVTSAAVNPQTMSQANLNALFDEDEMSKRKNKRGVLPKQATQVMKSWLFQHIVHPYPTEDEKRQIATQTNLTLLQVNNWFINARRRILQPMLDASNPETSKAKKSKPQTRPQQRFWPESIANITPQIPVTLAGGDMGETGEDNSPPARETQVVLPMGQVIVPVVTADGQVIATSLPQFHQATTDMTSEPSIVHIKTDNSEDVSNSSKASGEGE